jgi:hypothetical protein
MEKAQLEGYMEFTSSPADSQLANADLRALLDAVQATQIHTFGWPIGAVVLTNEYSPKPDKNGIHVEINRLDDPPDSIMRGYDYWSLGKDGTFYVLKSLFEDRRSVSPRYIFLDTRVVRTAEVFLRTARLYEALGVPAQEVVGCRIEYGGLRHRILGFANPMRLPLIPQRVCTGDELVKTFQLPLQQYLDPAELKRIVHEVVKGVTEMCDFFEPKRSLTDPIIDAFLQGRVM